MTNNFRALCADLLWALENAIRVIYHEDGTKHISTANPIVNRARAALAVPESREPTRDELWELWLRLNNELPDRPAAVAEFWEHAQIDARARATKADGPAVPESREPASVITEPSDAELVGKLVEAANGCAALGWDHHAQRILRAAELLERQATACAICERERLHQSTRAADLEVERQAAPVPVPVSERPPVPEDCDAEGRCWFGTPGCNVWGASWVLRKRSHQRNGITSWLPAHAMPLPEVGE